jgi:hypothetical protein
LPFIYIAIWQYISQAWPRSDRVSRSQAAVRAVNFVLDGLAGSHAVTGHRAMTVFNDETMPVTS